ncbi:MAG: DUF5395 domain-containing protein [Acidobacteriota bacterium]|nr:MAG: hypothetical protein D6738_00925 [Acidobacteriota bacterium]
MAVDLELVLTSGREGWLAEGDGVRVAAATLADLDRALAHELRASGRFPAGSRVRVFMACARSVIPEWMRPYQNHWFNRDVSLEL